MAISSEMQLKLYKIDALVEKGYSVKTKEKDFIPVLISPEGKFVNIFFKSKYGDDSLPGFSWIAFFFPFVFAAKIRNWKYFWAIGLIVPGAPGGIGVFESILILRLNGLVPDSLLIATLIFYRLSTTFADIIPAGFLFIKSKNNFLLL